MAKRKTNEQFKKEVFDLVGDEYTFLDPYVNNHTKLRVKHNKCGYVYLVRPHDFIHGNRCPKCAKKFRRTDKTFKQEVYSLVGDEYTFLDPYVNALTKIRVRHNKCGKIYDVTPNDFINNQHRCAFCRGLLKKTDRQFQQEVFDLVGDEYTFLDKYSNNKTKLRVKHNKCGNVYDVTPKDFIRGRRCPYCSKKKHKDTHEFAKEISTLGNGEYILLSDYINAYTKIKVKHLKCNTIYEVRPYSFLQGNRCPYCNVPKGETIIAKILNTLNINYEPQKTFDDLRDINILSYDFYVPDQSILIEYQGLQHYEPVDYFGGDNKFFIQQKHDKLKSDYAKDHGYTLIAVSYTEDTFSKIKKYLIKHGLKKRY